MTGPRSTPSSVNFTSSAYATTPPRNQSLAPSIALRAALMLPPVRDSAAAAVCFRSTRILAISSWLSSALTPMRLPYPGALNHAVSRFAEPS